MKKLLFALLIAFVVSAIVQTEDKELKGFDITKFVASLTGELLKLYKWLKSHGYWDKIVDLVKQYAVPAAINACAGWTGQYGICSTIINALATFIH